MDCINKELIKHESGTLLQEINDLLKEIFQTNGIPEKWTDTIQYPIAKIAAAKTVDNYRRITLHLRIYKIYARILLDRMRS